MRNITTVILAGGEGRRIGGNKALQIFRGRPLIEWVLDTVQKDSDEILISANDSQGLMKYGCRVIQDITAGQLGPLAGLQSALHHAQNEWVATVPCDTPFLPASLLKDLEDRLGEADCAVAVSSGRRQPAIALYRKRVLAELDRYLASGARKAGEWLDRLDVREVLFDDADAFININTQEELKEFEQLEKESPQSVRTGGNCLN